MCNLQTCSVTITDEMRFKVACTSGPIFEKNKRYPIFSIQIINYQIDRLHK